MDKRVELHDHTRRVDMNGECGVTATDCHCSRDMQVVERDVEAARRPTVWSKGGWGWERLTMVIDQGNSGVWRRGERVAYGLAKFTR